MKNPFTNEGEHQLDPNYVCEGTLMEPITLSSCDGFKNVCISAPISVRMSQALAYSTSLMGLLALIYNFQCKRENQKKEGSPQQDGESL